MPIRVGRPYNGKTGPLPEGTYYAWCGDRHELAVVHGSPGEAARAAVTEGNVELALVHEPPVIMILSRIAGLGGWREAPFCWHLLPRSERHLPRVLREGESAMLDLALVRAEDGVVDAAGWMTLDPAFSWVLHRAVSEEARRPWDPVGFHHVFEALRGRYPSPERLLELAVPCRRARIEGRRPPSVGGVVRAEAVGDGPAETPRPAAARPPPEEPPAETPGPDDRSVTQAPEPGAGC